MRMRERSIASAGQKKVLEMYTYQKQMEKIFDWVATNSAKK